MLASLWSWLSANATALGVVVASVPIIGGVVQYILIRRAEAKRIRFETFHSLIKQLVEQENQEQPMRIDRQIAVIYELRTFKHYFPVTLRILKGLEEDWADNGTNKKPPRLLEELNLSIAYIERKDRTAVTEWKALESARTERPLSKERDGD